MQNSELMVWSSAQAQMDHILISMWKTHKNSPWLMSHHFGIKAVIQDLLGTVMQLPHILILLWMMTEQSRLQFLHYFKVSSWGTVWQSNSCWKSFLCILWVAASRMPISMVVQAPNLGSHQSSEVWSFFLLLVFIIQWVCACSDSLHSPSTIIFP